MPRWIRGLSGLAVLAWPPLVWLSLTHPAWRWLIPLLAVTFLLRLLMLRRQQAGVAGSGRWLALAGVLLALASLLLQRTHLLLWYPVAVNAILLGIFAASLLTPVSLVERIARLREPVLSAAGVRYTRRVTQIWCLFFLANGALALATCLLGNLNLWLLWNGALSYLCCGVLMAGEWLVRRRVRSA